MIGTPTVNSMSTLDQSASNIFLRDFLDDECQSGMRTVASTSWRHHVSESSSLQRQSLDVSVASATAYTEQQNAGYSCHLCGYMSSSRYAHTCHMAIQHSRRGEFACVKCGKVFMTRLYLNQHMKSHGERKYACDVCGQRFLYKHHVPRHKSAVHGVVSCSGNYPGQQALPITLQTERRDCVLFKEEPRCQDSDDWKGV